MSNANGCTQTMILNGTRHVMLQPLIMTLSGNTARTVVVIWRRYKMNNCPVCGSDDVESSSSAKMRISTADCNDCGFGFQAPVLEQDIEAMWNVIEHFSEDDRLEMLSTRDNPQCSDYVRTLYL